MSDDIFDYFSGNATRKVEPIDDDDDDLDLVENQESQPVAEVDSDSDSASAAEPEPVVESREEIEKVAKMPEDVEAGVVTTTETVDAGVEDASDETGSHWDFLAGILGIGGGRPKATSAESTSTSSKTEKPKVKSEPKVKAESAPVVEQPVKESPVVDEEIGATESPQSPPEEDDLFAAFAGFSSPAKPKKESHKSKQHPRTKKTDTPASVEGKGDDAQPADFFGLDAVPSPEDNTPLQSMFSGGKESASSGLEEPAVDEGEDFIEFEVRDLVEPGGEESGNAGGARRRRRGHDSPRSERSDASDDESGRSAAPENERDESSRGSRGKRRRGGRGRSRDEFSESTDDVQVSSRDKARDSSESRSDDDERPARRRRSRGRGRGGRDRGPNREAAAEQVQTDDFLDDSDIGWDAGTDETLEVSSRGDSVGRSGDSGSENEGGTKRRRSRRGGRGRGRGRDDSERAKGRDDEAHNDSRAGDSSHDDFDRSEETGASRSKRRRDRGDSVREERGARREKVSDVPTWDDAITGLIESNIKNHKSNPRGGRSPNAGRGRGSRTGQRGRGRR